MKLTQIVSDSALRLTACFLSPPPPVRLFFPAPGGVSQRAVGSGKPEYCHFKGNG